MASLGPNGIEPAAIARSGWPRAQARGGAAEHIRDGSHVRIITNSIGRGQCIVDGYGERMDGFDAIRDAIGRQLAARFGAAAKLGAATGADKDFSRGQGFSVGNRIGVLSSERRQDGLSIRFTAMSFR
jgi:hypothetical protein